MSSADNIDSESLDRSLVKSDDDDRRSEIISGLPETVTVTGHIHGTYWMCWTVIGWVFGDGIYDGSGSEDNPYCDGRDTGNDTYWLVEACGSICGWCMFCEYMIGFGGSVAVEGGSGVVVVVVVVGAGCSDVDVGGWVFDELGLGRIVVAVAIIVVNDGSCDGAVIGCDGDRFEADCIRVCGKDIWRCQLPYGKLYGATLDPATEYGEYCGEWIASGWYV